MPFTPKPLKLPPMPKVEHGKCHSIKSLRLDLKEANAGRIYNLLPEGYRSVDAAKLYPLPVRRSELQKLAMIYIPPQVKDGGCTYLKRALDKYKKKQQRAQSAELDVGMRAKKIRDSQAQFNMDLKKLKKGAAEAIDEVRAEAAKQIANLNDLFQLGREGIEGQMRAHLAGQPWNGEEINARAFRECFRMVTQAVKGLGVPSDQKKPASDAIFEQYSKALKDTQAAVAMAPSAQDEKEPVN